MASQPYAIHLDTLFASLQLVDIQKLVDGCQDGWYNQTLCRVNDCVVRLGVMQGDFHWHKHDHEDEFFYVIEGRWVIDLARPTVDLGPRQVITIPKPALHRTRAPQPTAILLLAGPCAMPTDHSRDPMTRRANP